MVDLAKILIAFAVGYIVGSLNTSVIVGKLYGKDVRHHGSRSAGLTNTLRILGPSAAALVLTGDVLKGLAASLFGISLGAYTTAGGATDCVTLLSAGAGAVIGHNWPMYFGFKGGKGALTGAAVLFVVDPPLAAMCLAAFLAIVALTRYVSLGTVCAASLFVALSLAPFSQHTWYFSLFACFMAFIVIVKHRANIARLLSGTENKLSFGK